MSDGGRIYEGSPQHLQKLRERGLSPRSTNFIQSVGFASAVAGVYVCWPAILRYLKEVFRTAIQTGNEIAAGRASIGDACWTAAAVFVRATLIVCIAGWVGCWAAALLHMKPQLNAHLAASSLDRINPIKRMQSTLFAARAYRSLALNVVCSACIICALWFGLHDTVVRLWATGFSDPLLAIRATAGWLAAAVLTIAGSALAFGGGDLLLQKHDFALQSRMTYNEKLEEDRMQEQPEFLARELKLAGGCLEGGLGRVREAAVFARNPTHLAVGLAYSPHADQPAGRAPRVVCKGSGRNARRIVARAASYGIPVETNIALARSLYQVPLDSEIPAELYAAVDALLAEVAPRQRTSGSPLATGGQRGLYAAVDVLLRQLTSDTAPGSLRGVAELLARVLRARTK